MFTTLEVSAFSIIRFFIGELLQLAHVETQAMNHDDLFRDVKRGKVNTWACNALRTENDNLILTLFNGAGGGYVKKLY